MSEYELAFQNARLVLADRVIEGSLKIEDGIIHAIDEGTTAAGIDCAGDYLIPGLIELHTDHLEGHYAPRPGVRWPAVAAVQAHDAQIAGSGITTVFDALRIGMDEDANLGLDDMNCLAAAIDAGRREERLRAEHFIHLRCEVSAPDVGDSFDAFARPDLVRLVSLMDHTPGQRQFTSMETYKRYYQGKTKMSDAEFERFVARRVAQSAEWSDVNRARVARSARARGFTLASHDDATEDHIADAHACAVVLSEFPTTFEAAEAAQAAGLKILMGAPNVVRGGSHSGNVSASALAGRGLLDVLSSDYVPFSLLHAAFMVADAHAAITLPDAIAMVSRTPADVVGFDDRGEICLGLRADLVRVRVDDGVPIVRGVWREGRRVM